MTPLMARVEATSPFVPDSELTHDFEPAEPGTDGVPSEIGGFRLTRLLGAGGMGAVYEGVAEDSGQRVAVKLLNAIAKTDAAALQRFRQEGQLASRLAHPRCVFVLRADEEAGKPFIVMELMPGITLRDLVRERGPLPADEAIAKIVDVIDGLIEAHRLNILHRDVKPSNCFLMPDGRVKVGDFGLSKSLGADLQLTQTGSFLGTVLYAAPEQIRGDSVDYSADVYSVCATLYYLLCGQAPFQHENPTVVISRVISESPPDIALRRTDLPRRLCRIVMRGLERDPTRRFANLEELRLALSELITRPLNRGSLGARTAAYLIDLVVLAPIWILLTATEAWLGSVPLLVPVLPKFLYFLIGEKFFGGTVGKWALRLRVTTAAGKPPAWGRLSIRTLAFVLFSIGAGFAAESVFERNEWIDVEYGILVYVIGWFLLLIPMRARNGYRGLHEFLSGTRVVQTPWPRRLPRIAVPDAEPDLKPIPPHVPTQIGGFTPDGLLDAVGDIYRLHAEDSRMRREIHLVVRPAGVAPTSEARKTVARPTRTRWLNGGTVDGWAWDAYLAPTGASLPRIAAKSTLGWPETLSVLEQLTESLEESLADQSLVGPLSIDQVFVRPDGRLQLLDQLGNEPATEAEAMSLLRQVGPVAMEGKPRALSGKSSAHVRAIMPIHAQQFFLQLAGPGKTIDTIHRARNALRMLETSPAETATPQRLVSLGFQGLTLAIPLLVFLICSAAFSLAIILPSEAELNRARRVSDYLASHPDEVKMAIQEMADDATWNRVTKSIESWRRGYWEDAAFVRPGLNMFERYLRSLARKYEEAVGESDLERRNAALLTLNMVKRDSSKPPINRIPPGVARETARDLSTGYSVVAAVFVASAMIWSAITRGGMGLALAGLALVRSDGRRATWWQCGIRAAVIFAPPLLLFCLCVAVKANTPTYLQTHSLLWWAGTFWLAGYAIVGIIKPGRGPQDRLTGLHVVPR
ncbi:MAG: protein kinase [Gemmataceae bacterium]|nr:protein kinase [Gemmataceae bacterium]